MWLRTTCSMSFEIDVPTPFIFMLRPRSGGQQRVAREEYTLTPDCPMEEFTDNFGNLCQRLLGQPGPFSITTSADVKTVDTIEQAPGAPFIEVQYLPDSMLCYLLPSRYCESDRFVQMANEITADQQPGYDQVSAIQRWLRERIRYEPMLGNDQLSAAEVNMRQWGVCRDFAHLGIALCRSLSIPARMVVGYLYELDPIDMHAWFEAYVGGQWYTFDATQPTLRGGYVAIGYGRDAADVAIYNQFGPAVSPITQRVSVVRIDSTSD